MDTVNQINLVDIYRTLYPQTAAYTLFASTHGTFTRADHILGHEMSLDIQNMFTGHNGIKLEFSNRNISGKSVFGN